VPHREVLLPREQFPQADAGVVVAGGGQRPAICREGNRIDLSAVVPAEDVQQSPRGGLPEAGRAIVTARDQCPAVWRESHRCDPQCGLLVSLKLALRVPASYFPEPDCRLLPAGGEHLSVGGERDRSGVAVMTIQQEHFLPSAGNDEANPTVVTRHRQ